MCSCSPTLIHAIHPARRPVYVTPDSTTRNASTQSVGGSLGHPDPTPVPTPTVGRPSKPSLMVRVFLSALLGLLLGSWSPWDYSSSGITTKRSRRLLHEPLPGHRESPGQRRPTVPRPPAARAVPPASNAPPPANGAGPPAGDAAELNTRELNTEELKTVSKGSKGQNADV